MPWGPGQVCVHQMPHVPLPFPVSHILNSCPRSPGLAPGQGSDLLPGPPNKAHGGRVVPRAPHPWPLSHCPIPGISLRPPLQDSCWTARRHPFEARRAGQQQGAVTPEGVGAPATLSSLPDFKGTGSWCTEWIGGKKAGSAPGAAPSWHPPGTLHPPRTKGVFRNGPAWPGLGVTLRT